MDILDIVASAFKFMMTAFLGFYVGTVLFGHFIYAIPKNQWHCTNYDYNADMCIQYSRREK